MLSRILLNELVTMSIFVLRILEKKASDSKRKHHSYFSDKLLEVPYHMSQLTSSLCLPNRQDIMVFFLIPLVNLMTTYSVLGFFLSRKFQWTLLIQRNMKFQAWCGRIATKQFFQVSFWSFKTLKRVGLFHVLKGFAVSFPGCIKCAVLSKGHVYEAATCLLSVNQVSKDIQSMNNLRLTKYH